MDIFKLSKSLDELIFDILMWVIFYPYTLIRVLIWPGYMIGYAATELRKNPDKEELFDRGLSPPVFLFLSIVLAWMISPAAPAAAASESETAIAGLINGSVMSLLTYRLALYCVFPFAGALIYEWRTPGSISHHSFRLPFYQQAYLCAPLAIVFSIATVVATRFQDVDVLAFMVLAMLVIIIWYFWSQVVFFRRTMDSSWPAAAFWGLLSVCLGVTFLTGLDFIVGA
ncbi:hypothetical protein FHR22_003163 [Sphingopyxis panaciterrae]|uniref:hypothetical protein n=1 Tax=Sphingopyxis panaciterrae TaxID=363841 RepID=UPI00141E4014|nr:hypothetical protein [Sphingopyxis panaciterrae]NIJ38452.1 hypothetical protein [Sphingopyxis panaciterrae]